MAALEVGDSETYRVRPPLDFTMLWSLATMDRRDLRDPPWEPRTRPRLRPDDGDLIDLFAVIRDGDVLVHHPYDDFHTSVERFVEQAVEDPNVLAIKQTVYRTSGDSPIVPALMRAAEQGKQTVCLVEVQARFDEERNIQWARALERAGVHVVYGLSGLKTHAKVALVVRREGDRVRRYVHIGTGNYNPSTARLYTDLGLFTCREDLAEDVADLFNHLTGFARAPSYRKALVAPDHIRDGIIAEIDRVIAAHTAESPSRVVMKMNSIIDGPVIQAIYRASEAGVPVDLIVRGIAGLRPGVPGVSDNVRVISIVGRFLEHARIFAFTAAGETAYWIGSADMMARNLDNRVELIAPVEDPTARAEIQEVLDLAARRHGAGLGARRRRRVDPGGARARRGAPELPRGPDGAGRQGGAARLSPPGVRYRGRGERNPPDAGDGAEPDPATEVPTWTPPQKPAFNSPAADLNQLRNEAKRVAESAPGQPVHKSVLDRRAPAGRRHRARPRPAGRPRRPGLRRPGRPALAVQVAGRRGQPGAAPSGAAPPRRSRRPGGTRSSRPRATSASASGRSSSPSACPRSFSRLRTVKPGRWSPASTRGKWLRSCHESPVAPMTTSRASAGSRPARWPAPRASAVPAAITATSRLLTSLATRPRPTSPQWVRRSGSPMASSAGAARASAPASPPHMNASVPAAAPAGPPLTGQSR